MLIYNPQCQDVLDEINTNRSYRNNYTDAPDWVKKLYGNITNVPTIGRVTSISIGLYRKLGNCECGHKAVTYIEWEDPETKEHTMTNHCKVCADFYERKGSK